MCLDLINVLIEKPERERHATLDRKRFWKWTRPHEALHKYSNQRLDGGGEMTRTASYTRQEVAGSERVHAQWSITQKFEQPFWWKTMTRMYIYMTRMEIERYIYIHRQEVILNVDTPSEALHKNSNKRSDGKTMTRTAGYAD